MSILAALCVPHPPIILPAIGRGEEEKIQKTTDAYQQVMQKIAALQPETIVILSPHATCYEDWFHISPGQEAWGSFDNFGVPRVRLNAVYDEPLAAAISRHARLLDVPAGFEGERDPALDHGTMIPLYFLQQAKLNCKIVRIGMSGLPPRQHYALGQAIAQAVAATGRPTAIIASADLSHKLREDGPYGYCPEGPALDKKITESLRSGNFLELLEIKPELSATGAECGLGALIAMAGTLDGQSVQGGLLSYEGPFGVGYCVAAYTPAGPNPGRCFSQIDAQHKLEQAQNTQAGEDVFVQLARRTIKEHLLPGSTPSIAHSLPPELTQNRAGVFVSLHLEGRLRGCIGTISPTCPSIAAEIQRNAIAAATEDPRFAPLTAAELPLLVISVDVLGAPEPIDGPHQLDTQRFGVIVSQQGKRGLLLPALEGVDTPEQQIAIARRKAGIADNAPVQLERFEVVRHE